MRYFWSRVSLKCNQSEVAGLLVSVAAAVERQRRAGISAEEGFAQVCSRQSQAETTLQRRRGKQASQKVWRLSGLEKDNTENEIEKLSVWLILSLKSQTFQNKFSVLLVEGTSGHKREGSASVPEHCIPLFLHFNEIWS